MATVSSFLQSPEEFYEEMKQRYDTADVIRQERHQAVMVFLAYSRKYLIQSYLRRLSKYATVIQCAFRVHQARKLYRIALRRALCLKHDCYYGLAATKIQALWRGCRSRRTNFCYRSYRNWLSTVKERNERKVAETVEFGIRSKCDDLRILEDEARKWLAFAVFKLHHLLRTYVCTGIYSNKSTTELSDFEKFLKSIHYTDYMKRLKRKYDEFVRKHKPNFSNKRLFPIIGDGADYWYLSLPEMYKLTESPIETNNRHKTLHHGDIHKDPFIWKKVGVPEPMKGRGPFTPPRSSTCLVTQKGLKSKHPPTNDPRFNIYVKHYKPDPELFDYVDFHINVLTKRKKSILNVEL